jgi:hypothetical protein
VSWRIAPPAANPSRRAAFLDIYTGLNDLPSMRRMLAKSLEESGPALTLGCVITQFREGVRNDPEIQQLLRQI